MSESINDYLTAAIDCSNNYNFKYNKCGSACKFGNYEYFAELLLSALCTTTLKKNFRVGYYLESIECQYDKQEELWYHLYTLLPQYFSHKGHLTSQTTLQLIHCVLSWLFHQDEMILLQIFCCSAAGLLVCKWKSCNTYAFGQSLMLTSTALCSRQKCDLTSRECREFLEY